MQIHLRLQEHQTRCSLKVACLLARKLVSEQMVLQSPPQERLVGWVEIPIAAPQSLILIRSRNEARGRPLHPIHPRRRCIRLSIACKYLEGRQTRPSSGPAYREALRPVDVDQSPGHGGYRPCLFVGELWAEDTWPRPCPSGPLGRVTFPCPPATRASPGGRWSGHEQAGEESALDRVAIRLRQVTAGVIGGRQHATHCCVLGDQYLRMNRVLSCWETGARKLVSLINQPARIQARQARQNRQARRGRAMPDVGITAGGCVPGMCLCASGCIMAAGQTLTYSTK